MSLAALTSASCRLAACVTTLLMMGLPATSRSVAFFFSSAGFDSHFMNSHAAPWFLEYFEIENGIEIA